MLLSLTVYRTKNQVGAPELATTNTVDAVWDGRHAWVLDLENRSAAELLDLLRSSAANSPAQHTVRHAA